MRCRTRTRRPAIATVVAVAVAACALPAAADARASWICIFSGPISPCATTVAPVDLTVTPEVHALTLRWQVSGTPTVITGFRVRDRPASPSGAQWSAAVTLAASARSYTFKDLEVQPYEVRVRALRAEGLSAGLEEGVGTPLAGEEPPGEEPPVEEPPVEEPPVEEPPVEEPPVEEPPREEPTSWHGYSALHPMPAGVVPGSALSPWNEEVPAEPTVLANSKAMVGYLLKEGILPATIHRPRGGARPMYYAQNSDPVVELQSGEPFSPENGRKVHVPELARVEEEWDGHLTIVLAPVDERVPGETLDFWRASRSPGVIAAESIGAGNIEGLMTDIAPGSGDAIRSDLEAGLVRAPELAAGVVPHALTADTFRNSPAFVYPAFESDGTSANVNAPPMGQRFYLAYTVPEIEALKFPPWKQALLIALVKYGFYIGDSNGEKKLSFLWEGGTLMYEPWTGTEPFSVLGAEQGVPESGGSYEFDLASGIDWTRLRAIAPPLG
jgi:hypothetical protein